MGGSSATPCLKGIKLFHDSRIISNIKTPKRYPLGNHHLSHPKAVGKMSCLSHGYVIIHWRVVLFKKQKRLEKGQVDPNHFVVSNPRTQQPKNLEKIQGIKAVEVAAFLSFLSYFWG